MHMTSTILFWLVRLAWLFAGSSICYTLLWLGSKIWKRDPVIMPYDCMTSNETNARLRRRLTDGVWPELLRWTVRGSVLVAVFIVGYATRDLQSYRRKNTKIDVHILRHDDDNKYYIVIGDTGMPFEVKFCPDYTTKFDAGMTLAELTYEDRVDCWSVGHSGLGFKIARDPQGHILRKEVIVNVSRSTQPARPARQAEAGRTD